MFKVVTDLGVRPVGLQLVGTASEPALAVDIATEGVHCVAYASGELDGSTRNQAIASNQMNPSRARQDHTVPRRWRL